MWYAFRKRDLLYLLAKELRAPAVVALVLGGTFAAGWVLRGLR